MDLFLHVALIHLLIFQILVPYKDILYIACTIQIIIFDSFQIF